MTRPDNRRGIFLMIATTLAFTCQDGFSRHLADSYNTLMVVMLRYWVFAAFVILLALRRPEGFRAAVASRRLPIHALRALLLVAEIAIIVEGYTRIGLVESHAIFAVCPLLVVGLSVLMLGETLTRRRLVAVVLGLAGVLVVLQPGSGVLSAAALLPLSSAVMFALFSVLTRLTARDEPTFPAFFWPAVLGAAMISALGLPAWQPLLPFDWLMLAGYAATAVASNWLMLKTYEAAEASAVQPFAYFHTLFATLMGIALFGEALRPAALFGGLVIVAAGVYALRSEKGSAHG